MEKTKDRNSLFNRFRSAGRVSLIGLALASTGVSAYINTVSANSKASIAQSKEANNTNVYGDHPETRPAPSPETGNDTSNDTRIECWGLLILAAAALAAEYKLEESRKGDG